MSRWASKEVRNQREEIILKKDSEGLAQIKIASYLKIKRGSVQYVLKKHGRLEGGRIGLDKVA